MTVVEAAPVPGGRAGLHVEGGYRFDTGPTVLTMPHLVERCFAAAGADMADLLTLEPVDPMYRACFADGSELHVRHGRDAMVRGDPHRVRAGRSGELRSVLRHG